MFILRRLNRCIASAINASCRIEFERGFAQAQFHQSQKQLQQLVMADRDYMQRDTSGILKLFPQSMQTLHNMFQNLKYRLDPKYKCQYSTTAIGRIGDKMIFQTACTVNWPKPLTFSGYGFKKKDAERIATLKALEMFYNENCITLNGHPVTHSKEEQKQLIEEWTRPPTITVPSHIMEEGYRLIDEFEQEIRPFIEERNETSSFIVPNLQEDSEDEEFPNRNYAEEEGDEVPGWEEQKRQDNNTVCDLLTGQEFAVDEVRDFRRSTEMYYHLSQRLASSDNKFVASKPLPMSEYKDALQNALDERQVVIVAGDTGCGKSTQVPQMILDKWTMEEKGAQCNILVSQPRRIAAISLAKYIAHERKERLGESVGYHVRLSYKRLQNRGGIMFLTTGMLLQGLHANPTLEGVSHVIVDEVHERSVPTDLLLILLRRLILSNTNLKLILMSASLSTKELQNYFGRKESTLIEVPGALYPLTRHYLENVLSKLELSHNRYQLQPLMDPGSRPFINIDLVLDVIQAIEYTRPPGAILCFLPGWQDIQVVQMRLQENNKLKNKLWVLPLHSSLSSTDQEQIFEKAQYGVRKVVLATNIAETSLTIDDVVYVIDTGCHKEQRYDSRTDLSVLGNHWISKANSQQRAGRAGRVQAGEVFHLYSDNIHKTMDIFPVPEIMRIPLEHVVLQCKAYCGEESALTFLSDGLSVPSSSLIAAAVRNLEQLGMLQSNSEELPEALTPLGRCVVHFSTPPDLSKAIVYSSIFRCVDSVLSIVAALSSGRGIFHKGIEMRPEVRKAKANINPTSDLLAILGLIQQWKERYNYDERINYCNDNNLSHRALIFSNGIKKLYGEHLKYGYLIDNEDVCMYNSKWNQNSLNSQLLLGVLLAGVNRILLLQKGSLSKGIFRKNTTTIKTLEGITISTVSDCVLHTIPKNIDDSSRHLLCCHITRDDASRRTVARDLSLLQPLTVALFAGHFIRLRPVEDGYLLTIDGKRNISFLVDERTGNFLSELRSAKDQMVNVIIETRGLDMPLPPNFDHTCNKLVQYVSNLVENHEMKSIFYDDE